MQTSSSVSGANVGIHNGVCESLLVSLSSVTPPLSSSSRSRVTFCKVPFKVVGKRWLISIVWKTVCSFLLKKGLSQKKKNFPWWSVIWSMNSAAVPVHLQLIPARVRSLSRDSESHWAIAVRKPITNPGAKVRFFLYRNVFDCFCFV